MRADTLPVAGAIALGLGLGLVSAASQSPVARQSALALAPQTAQEATNPLAEDPQAPIAGRKLYLLHCAQCHDDGAGNRRRAPRLDSEAVRQAPPGDLFWLLTNGKLATGMPAWSNLPRARRWQIVSYLKAAAAAPPARSSGPSAQPY